MADGRIVLMVGGSALEGRVTRARFAEIERRLKAPIAQAALMPFAIAREVLVVCCKLTEKDADEALEELDFDTFGDAMARAITEIAPASTDKRKPVLPGLGNLVVKKGDGQ